MAVSFKPLGNRVVVEPIDQDEVTAGGIVLPETAKEKKKQGTVIEVGNIEEKELPVKKGDTILYTGYSSEELELNGEKYLLLDAKDVIAKIEG